MTDRPPRWVYKTALWQRMRLQQLRDEPLCRYCAETGRIVPATVVDHIVPHRGGRDLAFDQDNLQSLCAHCHNSTKQRQERVAPPVVGIDGWPVDERHMAYTGELRSPIRFSPELFWPKNLRPSAIPLTIVCGPPAAGKSTYVADRAKPGDVVIDLDSIVREMGGSARSTDDGLRKRALAERNRRLRGLADRQPGASAWYIATCANADTRRQWAAMLRPVAVIVIATPMIECLRRVWRDPERAAFGSMQARLIKKWWAQYTPWAGNENTIEVVTACPSGGG